MYFLMNITLILALSVLGLFGTESVEARIHRAPIIIPANKIPRASRYPLKFYRLYRTDNLGRAKAIPFQIDEVNRLGDFVLDQGTKTNLDTSNGYFDYKDELVFMGDDVGPLIQPREWPDGKKPQLVFQITFDKSENTESHKSGAVFLGVFFNSPPKKSEQKYVVFDVATDVVKTSRYEYVFDKKNYLVVKHIDMVKSGSRDKVRMIDSSTFYMNADLKYFLTVDANHRSVNSQLEAYKTGPVRTIVRVNFLYSFLNLNFEVGMYTEVSFFSNSVILPAIITNPIDGVKSLNQGSGFYYGFALTENPETYQFETNMESTEHVQKGFLDLLKPKKTESLYWASLIGEQSMMYVELVPSDSMLKEDNIPFIYLDKKPSADLAIEKNNDVLALGKSPVNMALYFDLTRFSKGEHIMSFQLFFENRKEEKIIEGFKKLKDWEMKIKRI